MASWESKFIQKLVQTGALKAAQVEEKIHPDILHAPEVKQVYSWMLSYLQEVGEAPTLEVVRDHFPEYIHDAPQESLKTICKSIRDADFRAAVMDFQSSLQEIADGTYPRDAINLAREFLRYANVSHSIEREVDFAAAADKVLDQYTASQKGQNRGILWPWAPLNEESNGMHPGEFIVLYGLAKSMKTWLLLYTLMKCFIEQNCRVLLYTKEMTIEQMYYRLAALMAQVPYREMKKGDLKADEEKRLRQIIHRWKQTCEEARTDMSKATFVIMTDDARHSSGIESLRYKIDEVRPHIIGIDAMYLMKDDRVGTRSLDWKNIAHISQDIKAMLLSTGIPGIATHQVSHSKDTGGKGLYDMAFGNSMALDADLIIRVIRIKQMIERGEESPQDLERYLALWFPGTREFEIEGFRVYGEPATNFGLIEGNYSADMLDTAIKNTNKAEKKDKEKKAPKKGLKSSFRAPKPV